MIWTTRPRSDLGGLAAISYGAGPDVLLLHGVGLRAEAWAAQLTGIPAARLTAPDMPGHGANPPVRQDMTMADYVGAALRVLQSLDGPALVVGHSMGAMLALELAARAPDRVRAVAALNAVFERTPDAAQAVQRRAASLDEETAPDPSPTLQRWFGDATCAERTACAEWLTSVDPQSYKRAYGAFAYSQTPSRAGLTALTCPALFMTGSDEPNSTPGMARAMAELAPRGRVQIVQGAAHMMPMSHPAKVNAALCTLLAEVCP